VNIYVAREIVYQFADIVAAGLPLIPDEGSLPWPKVVVQTAFDTFIAAMEAERDKDPARFIYEGYDETLQQAIVMMLRLGDFHTIDVADSEAVSRVNRLSKTDHWDGEVVRLLAKYPLGGSAT
jgi:hypothetical protein